MAPGIFHVFSRKAGKVVDEDAQTLASSALEIYGLPPSIIPLGNIRKFTISPEGRFQVKLNSEVSREVQNYTIKYSKCIRGDVAFGKLENLKGVYSVENKKLLPIDDLHIDWEDGDLEVVKLTIFGMECNDIPAAAFRKFSTSFPISAMGHGELQQISAT